MPARVCVCIRESTCEKALEALANACQWADLAEIRADYIEDLDVRGLLRQKPCPVLFTLRSRSEGGEYAGAERTRLETLIQAAKAGADWVDVEFSAYWQGVFDGVPKEKLILSYHNFDTTPDQLELLADEMASSGAGIVKIATTAKSLSDNLKIRRLLGHAAAKGTSLCALAMGRRGIPSRILGPQWGSWMVFASMPGGSATADGQISADNLVHQYRVREISTDTEMYGVVGNPLGHSLSPQIHNTAFLARGRDAVLLPLEAESVDDFTEFCGEVNVRGACITIPYKRELCSRAASLSVEADRIGAVNTLLRTGQGWHGANTDVEGFLKPLRKRTRISRKKAVVLGAGGAARAVVYGLTSEGAEVCVAARDPARGRDLAASFNAESAPWDRLEKLRWDLLVNTTPVGMSPSADVSPVAREWLTGEWVYDLVYNPRETKLLTDAASRGCKTISGVEMFFAQASKQQLIWCGAPVPENAMQDALALALDPIDRRDK